MEHEEPKSQLKRSHAIAAVSVLLLLSLLLETGITGILMRRNADRSTTMLITQVETVLEDNAKRDAEHAEELKETYISYAQTIAYILDARPELVQDIDELKKIAQFQHVDEIHIFDTTGTIVAGTEPKYYGYSMDSGEQMGFFKPMLEDPTLSLCQDIMPNTAEGKSMMYGMVWNEDGSFLVEVGVEPRRFLEQLKENGIEQVVNHIPLTSGFNLYAVDMETNTIAASTDNEFLDTTVLSKYASKLSSNDENAAKGSIRHKGKSYYCNYKKIGGYIVAVVYCMSSSLSSRVVPLVVLAVFMLAAGLIILRLFSRLYEANEESERRVRLLQETQQALSKAKEEAEAADRAKSTFLFNMSHDIRTPMNAIVGYTELIIKGIDDKERCMDYIHKIKHSSELLVSIINNVLEMARIESNKVSLNETATRTDQIPEEVCAIYSELMKEKSIDFVTSFESHTRFIYQDRVKIREILLNLISNAYKYTPEGGSVRVSFRELPHEKAGYIWMETTVADTGVGMSESFIPKMFEEFSRDDSAVANQIQGTGLGMSIVKRFVELMGGTIDVRSQLGRGTTFVLRIPHRVASSDHSTDDLVVVDESLFKDKRVLLAEDNELNAEISTVILEEMGFLVERACNGVEAVEMLDRAPAHYYDCVLMDIQMPKMSGYDARDPKYA